MSFLPKMPSVVGGVFGLLWAGVRWIWNKFTSAFRIVYDAMQGSGI